MKMRRMPAPKQRVNSARQAGDPRAYQRLLDAYNQGRYESADSGLDGYMKRFPEDPDAWNLRALLHRMNLRYDAAADCLEHAVQLNPKNATYWNNLGAMYKDLGRYEKAIDAFEKTIALDPKYADAYYNVGLAWQSQGNYELARQWYKKCLAIRPDSEMALGNLASLYKEQGRIEEAIQSFRELIQKNPLNSYQWSNLLLCLNYQEAVTAEQLYAEHVAYGRNFENAIAMLPPSNGQDRTMMRRLRIGFVSADFRTHSVAFFLMPLLVEYDRKRFEVFCYSNGHQQDETTQKMQAFADHWRNIRPMTDADAAQSIRNDGIDILIDLAGHSGYNRLPVFAAKPAPVQVTWLGYPNTTGMSRIDYRLSDAWTDPPGESDALNVERLYRLKGGFLCYQPPSDAPQVAPLPVLQNGFITFGSFNNRIKITAMTVRVWSRILASLPSARMVLKSSSRLDDTGKQSILDAFEAEGIGADRITILGYLPMREHFEAYSQIDIALDTFPYNGTTTTCEALYMGVPVLAVEGKTHAGRVSAGILARVGLSDWIAQTEDGYIALAVQKAADIDALSRLRQEMRARMQRSNLMDRWLFVAQMQDAFQWMWRRYCEKEASGRVPKLVVIGAMQAQDAGILSTVVENLIAIGQVGTKIVKVSINEAEEWDQQVLPVLQNETDVRHTVIALCRCWVPEAMLGQPGVFGCYVYRNGVADDVESNDVGTAPDSPKRLEIIRSHARWMSQIPSVVAFRQIDWKIRPSRMVAAMATRMGIEVSDEQVEKIAVDVASLLNGERKGMNEMAFDRSNKEAQWQNAADAHTVSLRSFHLKPEMMNFDMGTAIPDGLAEGYERPDVTDIEMNSGWWMSFPREDVSAEIIYARSCRIDPSPEQRLLQRWMQPGCCGVDIGAGFGLSCMTAAQAAGPRSAFYAFEPDRLHWAYFSRSIVLSGMHEIRLIRASIGNGTEEPVSHPNDPEPSPCLRLDDAMRRYGIPSVDWVRIGKDIDHRSVLNGGEAFFTLNSPLVQIACQGEGGLNPDLPEQFRELGYEAYRVVPGLSCLAPCGLHAGIDASQRYLFCCKPDRAAKLASMGVLVRHEIDTEATGRSHPSLWLDHVRHFPYVLRLIHLWEGYLTGHLSDPGWRVHQEAMSCYALSCTRDLPLEDRWQALGRAHRLLIDLIAKKATFSRLMTMARVASDMGYDSQAAAALRYLVRSMESGENVSIEEPFLFPGERLDAVDPGESIGNVVLVSILEALERNQIRLGNLAEAESVERIDLMRSLPFYDDRFDELRDMILQKQLGSLIDPIASALS